MAPEWAVHLATLAMPMNVSFGYASMKGRPIDEARNFLAEKAIEYGAKYLFFLDDDTIPPHDALRKLHFALENADSDVVFCGGVYCTKAEPPNPTIALDMGIGSHWQWKTGEVFECPFVGTGCLLIKTEVFEKLPRPWFKTIRDLDTALAEGLKKYTDIIGDHGGTCIVTDDFYFCHKVREAGFRGLAHGGVLPIHVDQTGQMYMLPEDSYPVKHGSQPLLAGFSFQVERRKIGA